MILRPAKVIDYLVHPSESIVKIESRKHPCSVVLEIDVLRTYGFYRLPRAKKLCRQWVFVITRCYNKEIIKMYRINDKKTIQRKAMAVIITR